MFRKIIAGFAAAALAMSVVTPALAAPYDALIAAYAKSNGVPLALATAVVKIESGFLRARAMLLRGNEQHVD